MDSFRVLNMFKLVTLTSSNRWAAQTPKNRGFLVKTVVFTVFDREIISNRELFSQQVEGRGRGSNRSLEKSSTLKLTLVF